MMIKTVDARGLSCPQPVLMSLKEMESMEKGEMVVLVDTETSKENVTRAVESKGWMVKDVQASGGEYRISITK